ncbi:unnamed protein product, partial [Linum tenue]
NLPRAPGLKEDGFINRGEGNLLESAKPCPNRASNGMAWRRAKVLRLKKRLISSALAEMKTEEAHPSKRPQIGPRVQWRFRLPHSSELDNEDSEASSVAESKIKPSWLPIEVKQIRENESHSAASIVKPQPPPKLKIWHRLFQSPSPRTPELTGEIDEIVVDLRPAATPYRICVKIELGPATADAEVVGTPKILPSGSAIDQIHRPNFNSRSLLSSASAVARSRASKSMVWAVPAVTPPRSSESLASAGLGTAPIDVRGRQDAGLGWPGLWPARGSPLFQAEGLVETSPVNTMARITEDRVVQFSLDEVQSLWNVKDDCCTKKFGRKVAAGIIGQVLEADVFSSKDTDERFVKVLALIDFAKPLRSQFMAISEEIGSFWVNLKSEGGPCLETPGSPASSKEWSKLPYKFAPQRGGPYSYWCSA